MHDVIIVGGGLFGATISKVLQHYGHSVLCFDARRRGDGTKAAACLMKPSWMTSLSTAEIDRSLDALKLAWGVRDFEFKVELITGRKLFNQKVMWCDPRLINGWREEHTVNKTVTQVAPSYVVDVCGEHHEARAVVVCAGWWSANFLWPLGKPEILSKLKPMAGISYITSKRLLPASDWFIRSFTPYRQLVAFTMPELARHWPTTWIGDGTSVALGKWETKHVDKSYHRAAEALELGDGDFSHLFGVRPALEGQKREFIGEVSRDDKGRLWLATGGAKNGTIGAGLAADTISRALA